MKRAPMLAAIFLGFILIGIFVPRSSPIARASSLVPPSPTPAAELQEIEQAIRTAIQQQNAAVLAYILYDEQVYDIRISADGMQARASLGLNDPETNKPVPSEPALVILHKGEDVWEAILPADPDWLAAIRSAPEDLVSAEEKAALDVLFQQSKALIPDSPLTGYLLPWPAGESRSLSQSVFHDYYTPSGSAHYAFDFYVHDTLWNVYASKAGTVWRFKYDIPTCYEYHCDQVLGNYIVLQDTTTTPTSYQLYLHLAYESIPENLRVVGAQVQQGQFIGIADNTGQSYGDHLHFQVHTNPDSYWGQSVDIKFDDVFINGGRPRTAYEVNNKAIWCHNPDFPPDVCNASQLSYVSLNPIREDVTPPYGGILEPFNGTTINSQTVHLSGWALDDDSGLYSAQFIARYDGGWQDVGESFNTSLFSMDWDLCADSIPDGPLSLALEIKDFEGNQALNLPGLTQLIKDYTCPQPAICTPDPDQVTIFGGPDYSGACSVLEMGDYPEGASLGDVGEDDAESIQIGADVAASLYSAQDYAGRAETISSSDSNLQDNLSGGDQLSSVRVYLRNQLPDAPSNLVYPLDGAAFPGTSSVSLAWQASRGGMEYQVSLIPSNRALELPQGDEILSPWLSSPVWHLDETTLLPGTYQWKVKARNNDLEESAWSVTRTFIVESPPLESDPFTAPYFDDYESGAPGWIASGLWYLQSNPDLAHSKDHSMHYGDAGGDYATGAPNSGDLTSPPISLPLTSTTYLLTFWSMGETESQGQYWDQRWIQVSENNGPFKNLVQLSEDPANYWIKPAIDLSQFAGSTIRVRFHFETLDNEYNNFRGWYLDDIQVTTDSLPDCADKDNSLDMATQLDLGETKGDRICPSGDMDYYTFEGSAGDRIVADVTTSGGEPPNELDLYLFLLDSDRLNSTLAKHDDEIPTIKKDPHLGYLLTRSGTYYLKLRAWDNPGFESETLTYTLSLSTDNLDPSGALTFPEDSAYIPIEPFTVTAGASDPGLIEGVPGEEAGSGVSHVEFWWHSSNWSGDDWEILGSDWEGEDGWEIGFDPTTLDEQVGMAFFANIYDWAGNWTGSGIWNLGLDRTPPASALAPISLPVTSTAIRLNWTASDNLSGLDHFDIQAKVDNGDWQDAEPDPGGAAISTWYIADAGNMYDFRMRAVDRAANPEAFPLSREASVDVPSGSALCSAPDAWDHPGNDNSPAAASLFNVGGPAATHNLCNPLSSDFLDDEDWFSFTAEKDQVYQLAATPTAGSAAIILELYGADGITLLDSDTPKEFGEPSSLHWKADSTGKVYLRARHLDGRVIGNAVTYQIRIAHYYAYFLPLSAKR